MKVYEGKDIRNLVVIGHSHSGKTSLVSAMLYTGGSTPKLGRVDDGSTVTDHDDEEISRQMTISASIASVEWHNTKINREQLALIRPGGIIIIIVTLSRLTQTVCALRSLHFTHDAIVGNSHYRRMILLPSQIVGVRSRASRVMNSRRFTRSPRRRGR